MYKTRNYILTKKASYTEIQNTRILANTFTYIHLSEFTDDQQKNLGAMLRQIRGHLEKIAYVTFKYVVGRQVERETIR